MDAEVGNYCLKSWETMPANTSDQLPSKRWNNQHQARRTNHNLLEDARPRSKSGLQALCSLHVALNKAKSLLLHCSECSKLYLAITGDSILMKFEKTRCALQESLRRVEDIVPQAIGCQIMEIVAQLEGAVFILDPSEKQVGEEVITLLRKEKRFNDDSNDGIELEIFHQTALKLGITSSRAALTERRALKKLIERAYAEEDNRKECIVAYLLHLMRKYSKLFRGETPDDTDSQRSGPCSPTILGSLEGVNMNNQAFEGQLTGNMPILPEEFRCPISLQLMYDPVIISSGQTYERVCIEKWFNDGHSTCPKTQQQLSHLSLTPNYCVKGLIAGWCEQNGVPIPGGPPESLDLNYWRLALSEQDPTNSRSTGTIDSCQMKGVKVVPLEENAAIEELKVDERYSLENGPCEDHEVDELERNEGLLDVLNEGNDIGKQHKAVEQIRFLLKDDEEARIYMGAQGFVEALVRFLKSAIREGDERAQEVGALALFNLAVNNNRYPNMKLDTTGIESFAPLHGGMDDLHGELWAPPSFDLPVCADFDGFQKTAIRMVKPAKGTTTLAFVFKEGIIVAAESRTSMGGYVASQNVKKIVEINPHMIATVAGGAADCIFWHRNLGVKGPSLYYVDSEGGRLKGSKFSVGSGSPYAYAVLDNGYRYDMPIGEAAELARRAIYHATFRDGASGGVAVVYHVGPDGWKKLSGDDVKELHDKYYPAVQVPAEQEMMQITPV
ncbi:putative Proteasome subunit beta type-5 [Cocos nucifera]|uniref:RING-type E3 ubiquitin transferase n=1 Tax=Cocos nucifera TaxID=13894 RepID=A0A8K0MXN6_COCNU|nr:putative Proteasome subunit beta type-5 [Cocos nucifera]